MLGDTGHGDLDRVRFCIPGGGERVLPPAGECIGGDPQPDPQ